MGIANGSRLLLVPQVSEKHEQLALAYFVILRQETFCNAESVLNFWCDEMARHPKSGGTG